MPHHLLLAQPQQLLLLLLLLLQQISLSARLCVCYLSLLLRALFG